MGPPGRALSNLSSIGRTSALSISKKCSLTIFQLKEEDWVKRAGYFEFTLFKSRENGRDIDNLIA